MRSSKWLWRVVGMVSLAATLVLLFGFGYAVNDLLNPSGAAFGGIGAVRPDGAPAASEGGTAPEGYRIAALGDSLTKGAGDETGQGYVKPVMELLKERTGQSVSLINNLAINGMTADELAAELESNKGYRYAIEQANVILLTIGGNDLFAYAQSGAEAGEDAWLDPERAEARMAESLEKLGVVLDEIAVVNPEARIVYVGLYNPFYDVPELREGSMQVQQWNNAAFGMLHRLPNAVLVPTADLFERDVQNYLSQDHFHPNRAGYARIAERIAQALY